MNNNQRQYAKVSQGGDKLLQKRIRSNVPTKNIAEKENTQKNLQKTNPRMASARANPRQDKQSIKTQEQMLQQQQLQLSQQMLQMGTMGAMLPGFAMPQQQMLPGIPHMQPPAVGIDVQNQIAALQQRITALSQLSQLQAQLGQLQTQTAGFGFPQFGMPGQIGVPQANTSDPLLHIANQIQYHDIQQQEGSKKTSPQKSSAYKKNYRKGQVGAAKQTSERQSPDNERFGGKRADPVVLQAENLPVARTTRSGRPIENSPVKNAAKNAGISGQKSGVAAAKFEKKLPTQPNSQATQGTIGTHRSSNRTPAKSEIQNEYQRKALKNAVSAAKPAGIQTRPNKAQKFEGDTVVRRSTRFSGVKEELVALEDVFGNKSNSPYKKASAPKSKYVDESSESIQDKSDTSSNLPVRRSIRHRASPPKEFPLRETRHSNRVTRDRDSQKTTSQQSQGNENKNEDSTILQQLKNQLMQTEMEYTSKIAANKERDIKKEKRNNSSETRRLQKAKQAHRPPTKDEMMLFGDVLLNTKKNKDQVSEFDTQNPLETGGQQKYEAQTEIIMKNEKLIEEQEFTDDEDDKAIRSQLEKEKEAFKKKDIKVIDESKIQDMGILFGMKEDEVKDFTQKQYQTLQTLKDESMLFGEPVKPEIFAQQQNLSQSVKNEQYQLSEQILVTEENSKSQNLLNLISQNDQEMKNESVGLKSQDPENTVSDHEELIHKDESGQKENQTMTSALAVQTDQKQVRDPVEYVTPEVEKEAPIQASNKISDLDRQIAEIKKAIAIQQEVTNRKLNEQAQKEQEELEQAERDQANRYADEREKALAEDCAREEAAAAEERQRQEIEAAEERKRQESAARAVFEDEQRINRIHEENILKDEKQLEQQREAERIQGEKLEADRQYAEEQQDIREAAEKAAEAERERIQREQQEKIEQERLQQERLRIQQVQQEQLKQQELSKLRHEREQQLKQEEQRKQYEALQEQKRKIDAENLRRQQAELFDLQNEQAAEEKRKQEQMQEYNKLIEERNKIHQQEQMVRQQLAEEQRKKVERLEQQAQEARHQLAEEQKKKLERAKAEQVQREQEEKEKQQEMEERARLLQIAENPSTEQHQIEIISDSMQDDSDMQYGYENIQAEPISYQLSENLIENIQLCDEYSLLLKFQQSIDQSIGFNIQRSQSTTFGATKFFVEESLKRQFKQSHFQKILYVGQEFYNHKWEMKYDKPELMILVPKNAAEINQFGAEPSTESYSGPISSSLQQQRSKIFKLKLVQIMVDHFQAFKSSHPQLQNFNIHNTHKWPSSFDIEDKQIVPEIPLQQLKEQPKMKQKTTVNDFISVHDHQKNFQQAAKEAIEKDQEMRYQEQGQILEHVSDRDSSEEERIRGDKMINKTGFSQATMDAIQFKQSIETEKRQKSQEIIDSQSQQSSQNLLIKASDQIKSIFTIQQGSTIFLVRLQNSMMDQHRGNFVSRDHVKDLIVQLTKIVPEWITLKTHPQGTLVKCHKTLNLSHYNIRSKIEDYFRNDNYEQQSKTKLETNSQDQRISKSCPPPISSSANNQKQSQGSNSGFKNFSAFQPFQRKQSFNNNDPDSLRKNETIQIESRNSSSINKNNFGINQGNSSISISGQGPFNRNYPDSNLQYQTAQIQPSSSGTYLSGPSGLSGGEAEHQPNTQYPIANQDIQMSKYLSPQKPMGDSRISVSNAVNNALESRQGMNNFGQDPYQNSYDNNQGRFQSTNYGRSTSMPHHYMS